MNETVYDKILEMHVVWVNYEYFGVLPDKKVGVKCQLP